MDIITKIRTLVVSYQRILKKNHYVKSLFVKVMFSGMIIGYVFFKGLAIVQAIEIMPVFPDNQVKKDINYFDLKMDVGQEQTIELLVRNTQKDAVSLHFNLLTAMTNELGTVDYLSQHEAYQWDPSLPYQLAEFISMPQEVTVPARSEGRIPINIKMPNSSFSGMLLGAIEVQVDELQLVQEDVGMQVNNKVRYLILLKLTESNNPTDISIEWNGLTYDQENRGLLLKLRNPVGVYLFDVQFRVKIYNMRDQMIFDKEIKHLEMAPYSYLNYFVPLDQAVLEENNMYQVSVILTADGYEQSIQDTFTLRNTEEFIAWKDKYQKQIKLIILVLLIISVISIVYMIKKIDKDVD